MWLQNWFDSAYRNYILSNEYPAETTTTFDHHFEGWSVWLEFQDPKRDEKVTQLHQLMDQMQMTVFPDGKEASKHKFAPHMTLLYNFELKFLVPVNNNGDDESAEEREAAQNLLNQCRDRMLQEKEVFDTSRESVPLRPKEWFTFDYPKSADNGKGFGAAISLLILENDATLQQLYQTVCTVFPTDERQSFTPHVSLVYAPQQSLQVLTFKTNQLQKEQILLDEILSATTLSVWSTRGPTKDWYQAASIDLASCCEKD